MVNTTRDRFGNFNYMLTSVMGEPVNSKEWEDGSIFHAYNVKVNPLVWKNSWLMPLQNLKHPDVFMSLKHESWRDEMSISLQNSKRGKISFSWPQFFFAVFTTFVGVRHTSFAWVNDEADEHPKLLQCSIMSCREKNRCNLQHTYTLIDASIPRKKISFSRKLITH